MTAALELETRTFTDGQFYTAAYEGLKTVAHLELNEAITETDATGRVTNYLRSLRRTLTTEARNDAYEQLREALARQSCLNMPHQCHCHDWTGIDTEAAELDADYDAHNAIKKLIGERP